MTRNRKLTTEDVISIRQMARDTRKINSNHWVEKLGISKSVVGMVVTGKSYSDIPGALTAQELDAPTGGGSKQTKMSETQWLDLKNLRESDPYVWTWRALAVRCNTLYGLAYSGSNTQRAFRARGWDTSVPEKRESKPRKPREPKPSKVPALNKSAAKKLSSFYAQNKPIHDFDMEDSLLGALPDSLSNSVAEKRKWVEPSGERYTPTKRPTLLYGQRNGFRAINIWTPEGRKRLRLRMEWDRAHGDATDFDLDEDNDFDGDYNG